MIALRGGSSRECAYEPCQKPSRFSKVVPRRDSKRLVCLSVVLADVKLSAPGGAPFTKCPPGTVSIVVAMQYCDFERDPQRSRDAYDPWSASAWLASEQLCWCCDGQEKCDGTLPVLTATLFKRLARNAEHIRERPGSGTVPECHERRVRTSVSGLACQLQSGQDDERFALPASRLPDLSMNSILRHAPHCEASFVWDANVGQIPLDG